MSEDRVLLEAEFTPKVQAYWMLGGVITCIITVVGIVVLPVWLLIGGIVTTKYRQSMKCVLTQRSLKFSKGVLVRVEKTIPLEKITDLGMVQGPIMRAFGLHAMTVETAGQSSGPGALVTLTGVVDPMTFRDAVLKQRDLLADAASAETPAAPPPAGDAALLTDIRDTLRRIEQRLAEPGR